jgi:hypothetical protein
VSSSSNWSEIISVLSLVVSALALFFSLRHNRQTEWQQFISRITDVKAALLEHRISTDNQVSQLEELMRCSHPIFQKRVGALIDAQRSIARTARDMSESFFTTPLPRSFSADIKKDLEIVCEEMRALQHLSEALRYDASRLTVEAAQLQALAVENGEEVERAAFLVAGGVSTYPNDRCA